MENSSIYHGLPKAEVMTTTIKYTGPLEKEPEM